MHRGRVVWAAVLALFVALLPTGCGSSPELAQVGTPTADP